MKNPIQRTTNWRGGCGRYAMGVFVSEFKREDRFIVLKRKDLEALNHFQKAALAVALEKIQNHLPARQYVVVESDWPEYEFVWEMIQARVEGKPNRITALEADNAKLKTSLIPDLRGRNKDLLTRAQKAEADLAQLRESMRWIPVSERLPEDDTTVLVAGGCAYYQSHNGWFTLMGSDAHRRISWVVTHWMPLPKPPEDSSDAA